MAFRFWNQGRLGHSIRVSGRPVVPAVEKSSGAIEKAARVVGMPLGEWSVREERRV